MKKECYTYRLEIHGMRCGMCESHINDVIRKNFKVIKVKSSRLKKLTVIKATEPLDLEKVRAVINETGYHLIDIKEETK